MTGIEVARELLKHPDAKVQLAFLSADVDIIAGGFDITYDEVRKIIDLTVDEDGD